MKNSNFNEFKFSVVNRVLKKPCLILYSMVFLVSPPPLSVVSSLRVNALRIHLSYCKSINMSIPFPSLNSLSSLQVISFISRKCIDFLSSPFPLSKVGSGVLEEGRADFSVPDRGCAVFLSV